MTNPKLTPAAQAVWDAFNKDEAGVFVDYGDKLAAALRAAGDHVPDPQMSAHTLYAIADELENHNV